MKLTERLNPLWATSFVRQSRDSFMNVCENTEVTQEITSVLFCTPADVTVILEVRQNIDLGLSTIRNTLSETSSVFLTLYLCYHTQIVFLNLYLCCHTQIAFLTLYLCHHTQIAFLTLYLCYHTQIVWRTMVGRLLHWHPVNKIANNNIKCIKKNNNYYNLHHYPSHLLDLQRQPSSKGLYKSQIPNDYY